MTNGSPGEVSGHSDALKRGGRIDAGWRVILVGRTGLDQVLRRVHGVELIRTRDSFDAIGELSDPIDDASPARAAVLVAPDAEPVGQELGRFVEALRMVDSGVKVIRVGAEHSMYDGVVWSHASANEVMRVIEDAVAMPRVVVAQKPVAIGEDADSLTETTSKAGEIVDEAVSDSGGGVHGQAKADPDRDADDQEIVPTIDHAQMRSHAESDSQNMREVMKLHQRVMSDVGGVPALHTPGASTGAIGAGGATDEPVIRAMGQGRPVLDDAMKLIAQRTGRNDIAFSRVQPIGAIAVRVESKVFGSLVCADSVWASGAGARVLNQHAAWLGAWLRLEAQQRELRLAAFTDELTGAWNRRYFKRFLDAAIDQARSARRTLTLLYFDIDDFKGYNDRHGHAAGDEILVETVRLLESVIRPGDKVCRIGGDEFVVIFYEPKGPRDPGSLPPESIYEIATRFQKQVCTHRFPKLGDEASGTLTVSGGLASYPWDGSDGESLLALADELALKSKRSGKNVITLGHGAQDVCGIDPEQS
ncbi:MAG: GGDEF domain-containing protein [Phycisphaerales bacterium]